MMFGPSLLNPWVMGGIALAVLGAYGLGSVQQFHRDEIRWTKKVGKMQQEAQEEKARIELQRQKDRESAELRQQEMERERNRLVARSQKRIAELDAAVAALRVPVVGRLLNDTIDEASGAAGAAAKPRKDAAPAAAGADVAVGDWAAWSVSVVALYSACRDQVIGLQQFYNKLRAPT